MRPCPSPSYSSLTPLVTPPIWGKQLRGYTKFIGPYSEVGYLNQQKQYNWASIILNH